MSFKRYIAVLTACTAMVPAAAVAQQASAAASAPATPAADETPSSAPLDIVVTARKRSETSLAVPVVLTAIGGAELQSRAIVNVEGIARVVPQLLIGPDTGVQGGTVAIRGVSGPAGNSFGDQAVAFNIDGVPVAKSSVRRMAQMDLAQVEVLKGPQALFYGKNSPGGIITMRTADPTSSFEGKASLGYEFNAREIRGEGYVSGPLSDTLGVRVAGYYSHMQGDVVNNIPTTAYLYSTSPTRLQRSTDWAGRITLKWEPSDRFSARFKASYAKTNNDGPSAQLQKIACVTPGAPQSGATDDCRPNNQAANGSPGPLVVGQLGYFRDGRGYADQWQTLDSLEMNYDISDKLKLTSVSGVYAFGVELAGNFSTDYALDLASAQRLTDRELSQELRLQSDFKGPFDFVFGAFATDTHQATEGRTFVYAAEASAIPLLVASRFPATLRSLNSAGAFQAVQDGSAWSVYGQAIIRPLPRVEITAGGRYSDEKKSLPLARAGTSFQVLDSTTDKTPTFTERTYHDFSPEITAAFRPDSSTNLFVSYKRGFLSGGFNVTATTFVGDVSYNPETVEGFEAGFKKAFGSNLRINLAAYTYKINDLQVTTFINAVSFLKNAAAARVKGIEGDFTYRTPVEGLTLNGAFAYNHGRYTSFDNAACFRGQTPTQGCSLNVTLGANTQSLTGKPLIQTPSFSANLGFNFEDKVSQDLKFGLSSNVSYSSSYFSDAFADPAGMMPRYALVDASVRLGAADDKWELALIGRNLTNRYYWTTDLDISFTGIGTGTAAGVRSDKEAGVSRGREMMLRLTVKFK